VSDMIDGWVARKTNTTSEFGAKLDTFSDFIFVLICLLKLIPSLKITVGLALWIGVIACIKIVNMVYGYVVQKQLISVHSYWNKVTGALLFFIPFTLSSVDLKYSASVVCTVATIAAIQEGYYVISNKNLKIN